MEADKWACHLDQSYSPEELLSLEIQLTFSRLFVEDSQLMKKNDHNIKSSKPLENFYEVVWQYIASTLKQTSNLQLAKRMENRRLI